MIGIIGAMKDEVQALKDSMQMEETKEIAQYLEDGSCDYDKLMSGDYILTADNDNAAEIYGWEFTVGDTIALH